MMKFYAASSEMESSFLGFHPQRCRKTKAASLVYKQLTRVAFTAAKSKKKKDHFDRLPDDLIVIIFNKVLHAKYLFRCISVCKRFASLIPQTTAASIALHLSSKVVHNSVYVHFIRSLVTKPFRFLHRGGSINNHLAPPRALYGLKKFSSIKSLRITIQYYSSNRRRHLVTNNTGSMWIKYKAMMGVRLEILVANFAFSVRETNKGFNNNSSTTSTTTFSPNYAKEMFMECLNDSLSTLWDNHRVAQNLLRRNLLPELCEIVMVNDGLGSMKGKLCMGKEQIVELREMMMMRDRGDELYLKVSDVIGSSGVLLAKQWHTPVLELMSSGHVMELAMLAVARPENEEIVMDRDVGLISNAFEEDDDDDIEDGKIIDEVVNVVREKMVADASCSIKTHRLQLKDQIG